MQGVLYFAVLRPKLAAQEAPMKAFLLALVSLAATFSTPAFGSEAISQRLQSEFSRLRELVTRLEPEFEVGGYLKGKSYGDHELLWRTSDTGTDAEVIRIYRDKGDKEQAFDVTFHRNDVIVRGRTVIRRFVGPASTGWRNDTIDAHTGEYLGSQGASAPRLDARDEAILRQWDIRLE